MKETTRVREFNNKALEIGEYIRENIVDYGFFFLMVIMGVIAIVSSVGIMVCIWKTALNM